MQLPQRVRRLDAGRLSVGGEEPITSFAELGNQPGVIVAQDASEIQPAIDQLSDGIIDENFREGIVQLLPKGYYPQSTIFLKRGVTIRGTRFTSNPVHFDHSNPISGGNSVERTTIFTSQMKEGRGSSIPERDGGTGVNTWSHFDTPDDRDRFFDAHSSLPDAETLWEYVHPHFAVINGYDRLPYTEKLRDRTAEEEKYRGNRAGLKNIRLHADKQRWWDPSGEDSSSTGTDGLTDAQRATYFGVYDGLLFENTDRIVIEGVHVTNFLGYNGFYMDTRDVLSRGNFYSGTATDHHGASFMTSRRSQDPTPYTTGIWDLEIRGPTPTAILDGHLSTELVRAGWSRGRIHGDDNVFLGSESEYEAGNAPMADPGDRHKVVVVNNQHAKIHGYTIEAGFKGDGNPVALDIESNRTWVWDSNIGNGCHTGIDVSFGIFHDSDIKGSDRAVAIGNRQGTWHGCRFAGPIDFGPTANPNPQGGFHDCLFVGNEAIRSAPNGNEVMVYNPTFAVDTVLTNPDSWGDGQLLISNPRGYVNHNKGQNTQSGDGITTSFTIPHGLDESPAWARAEPMTPDAAGITYTEIDDTNVTVNYETAPPDAVDNLQWMWQAKGWSAPGIAT